MSCAIWQVVSETIDDLINDPALGDEILDELKSYNEELGEDEKIYLDLDKSWDGLNFLLEKKKLDSVCSFIKKGGKEIKAIEQGYGTARYFNPEETSKLFKIIHKMDFKELSKGTTQADLIKAEIYPFQADELDALGYLKENWQALLKFLEDTTARRRGILTYLF